MIPKFRAYIKSIQKIVDVLEIDLKNKMATLDIATNKVDPEPSFWWKETELAFSVIELMQSIGLKDENGVEIYEGDLVEYRDGEESFKGEVMTNCFGAYVKTKNDYVRFEDFSDENTRFAGNCYIVGNIYENLELLKEVEVEE